MAVAAAAKWWLGLCCGNEVEEQELGRLQQLDLKRLGGNEAVDWMCGWSRKMKGVGVQRCVSDCCAAVW